MGNSLLTEVNYLIKRAEPVIKQQGVMKKEG